ncbi:uncharacterized protein (TIGR02271 family) [Crossiella equi]|uniref:Uncharacterized protein (TIGR02271 family) n=1 Tax=Crossiella equi TaxID=130796 RepID=A0ABS5AD77_9PSEU|nr:PRC and DUF2382 domain-containing protein [Crossiella equi]MBP2474538.1 uncharacterized protein (TIGR02271 family) [Crossiella equi]
MISEQMVPKLFGDEVCDREGTKIGKVGQVYLDEVTGKPVWATVRTGLFGMKESFVPLESASLDGDVLRVGVTKDQVGDAPRIDAQGRLSSQEEQQLYAYYGMRHPGVPQQRQDTAGPGEMARAKQQKMREGAGREHAGHEHGESMTRSEERLKVGAETRETGRVRLRKYVVTEEQQVTVPVRHEEVRLEREPITDADRTAGRARIGEAEQEVVLHAERPVVRTEAVPVERVRLAKETVTEEQTVSGQVRKEQVEISEEPTRGKKR